MQLHFASCSLHAQQRSDLHAPREGMLFCLSFANGDPSVAAASHSLMRGMAQTPDSDMHSDFQPQVKSSPAASATEQIQQDIKDHKVFVYMKV